ncbi:MAG TPA: alpha/beta hydrolase [Armatimonadetes bacterium]|nr:alpha/beta hydrolase [Armatimonadota bacterium]
MAGPIAEWYKEHNTLFIWPDGAPGALGEGEEDRPTVTVSLPKHPNKALSSVVVCPGGGYSHLALGHEGRDIAEWLNSIGVAAFVLKYRLGPKYHHPCQMQDVLRAVQFVRAGASNWNIDPSKIGVWGFSAGGHLASTAATHFNNGNPSSADPVERKSSRPDFAILSYPVLSSKEEYRHSGSFINLLGENPSAELLEHLSNELHVTANTPPTFLFHTNEDTLVMPENSVLFYLALRKAGVPAEIHIYEPGPHGVGLAPGYPALSSWSESLKRWFETRGLLI